MATTVRQLINYLQDEDQDATVVFQYILAEHIDMDEDEFEEKADALEDTSFADASSEYIKTWILDM